MRLASDSAVLTYLLTRYEFKFLDETRQAAVWCARDGDVPVQVICGCGCGCGARTCSAEREREREGS